MNAIIVTPVSSIFTDAKWQASYQTGERTFIHGHYLYKDVYFKSLPDLLKWAKENRDSLDWAKGGGYGIGVIVYLENMVLAEYWEEKDAPNDSVKEHFYTYIRPEMQCFGNSGDHLYKDINYAQKIFQWVTK